MHKPIRGFDINVDDEVKMLIKKYPRFESVNAGYWLYGKPCLLYTSPSPRDRQKSRMPSSA